MGQYPTNLSSRYAKTNQQIAETRAQQSDLEEQRLLSLLGELKEKSPGVLRHEEFLQLVLRGEYTMFGRETLADALEERKLRKALDEFSGTGDNKKLRAVA